MNKHPIYGFLTEREFNAMKDSPPSQKKYWMDLAAKREREAKKRKPKREITGAANDRQGAGNRAFR